MIFFILLLIGFSSFGNVEFLSGYAVHQGVGVKKVEVLKPSTLLVCNPDCVFIKEKKRFQISFASFGIYSDLQPFVQEVILERDESTNGADDSSPPSTQEIEHEPKAEKKASSTIERDLTSLKEEKPQIPYNTPYPKVGTVFLSSSGGKIYIFPIKTCKKECVLEIVRSDGKKEVVTFKKDSSPIYTLTVPHGFEGNFFWNLKGLQEKPKGQFSVQNNTTEALSKALFQNLNVEYLQ